MFLMITANFSPPSQVAIWEGINLRSSALSKRNKCLFFRSKSRVSERVGIFHHSTLSIAKEPNLFVHLLLKNENLIYPPVPVFQMQF